MNKDTAVIVPVFNEEEVIASVIEGLKMHFSKIVCVDDGSSDNSIEIMRQFDVDIIRHLKNRGQGAAIKTGIDYALNDPSLKYLVTFDADGQHRVTDALRMVEYLRVHKDTDVVLGSRFMGNAEGIPITKTVLLKMAIWFSNVTTGLKLTDTHNGLRVMSRKVADKMDLKCRGMAHASEIIYRIAENKFNYAELPVTITYSKYSKAKGQSVLNSFNILKELLQYRLQREN